MEIVERISHVIAEFLEMTLGRDAISSIIDFLVFIAFSSFIWFLNPLSMRFPFVRRLRRHEEKYSGHYVQIIQSGEERRYSLVTISHDARLNKYVLSGTQYDAAGHAAIEFKSDRVFVVESMYYTIEFSWVGGAVDLEKYEGFTKMIMRDPANLEMLDGQGFFITFDEVPRRVDLKFVRMSPKRLGEFDLVWPTKAADSSRFVVDFHATLQRHPELIPEDKSRKPPLI